jgi:hypothetical protein
MAILLFLVTPSPSTENFLHPTSLCHFIFFSQNTFCGVGFVSTIRYEANVHIDIIVEELDFFLKLIQVED